MAAHTYFIIVIIIAIWLLNIRWNFCVYTNTQKCVCVCVFVAEKQKCACACNDQFNKMYCFSLLTSLVHFFFPSVFLQTYTHIHIFIHITARIGNADFRALFFIFGFSSSNAFVSVSEIQPESKVKRGESERKNMEI